ncbi:DUF4216 domain-containing protein [Citrus sinensis]|nr:DUF4216 domain-containing protein [Citrus sinensis]
MMTMRCEGSIEATDQFYSLACGPNPVVYSYSGCNVNGVRYHVHTRDKNLKTQNSGVMVPGQHGSVSVDFYGVLSSVIELNYIFGNQIILFKCDWFDTNFNKKRIQKDYHLTSINVSRMWYENDPFVLAIQVRQVFYVDDYKLGSNWKVVNKMQHRHMWDVPEINDIEESFENVDNIYQENESSDIQLAVEEECLDGRQFNRPDVSSEEADNDGIHNEGLILEDEASDIGEEDETIENYCRYWIMAPVGSRRSRSVAGAQARNELAAPTNSLSNSSSNAIPVANIKKNKRSKSRGLKLDKLIHQSQAPLPIEFCETMKVPVGANAAALASDTGVVLTKIAPLGAKKWKDVPESQRILMIDDIASKFVIDVHNPIIRNYLLDKLATRFKNFRHQLKKEFEQYPTVEEAKRNPPKDLRHKQAEWESLCDYFSSEAFKIRSEKNKQNRSKVSSVHRGGSKSHAQHLNEMTEMLRESPGLIALFRKMFWSEAKGWSSMEAKAKYDQMIDMKENSNTKENVEPLTDNQICEIVLGKKSNFVKKMIGPLKLTSNVALSQQNQEMAKTIEEQAKKINEQDNRL